MQVTLFPKRYAKGLVDTTSKHFKNFGSKLLKAYGNKENSNNSYSTSYGFTFQYIKEQRNLMLRNQLPS